MGRRAFTDPLALVPLLCLAMIIGWAASFGRYGMAHGTLGRTFYRFACSNGVLEVQWERDYPVSLEWKTDLRAQAVDWAVWPQEADLFFLRVGRFPVYELDGRLQSVSWRVLVPAVLLIVLPAVLAFH